MTSTDLVAQSAGSPPVIYVPSPRGGAPIPVTEALSEVLSPPKLTSMVGSRELDLDLGPIEAPRPPDLVFPAAVVAGGGARPPTVGGGSSTTPSSTTTSTSSTSATTTSTGPLKRGSSGTDVEKLQALLNRAGAKPPLKPDGDFGPATDRALRDYQASQGLKPDGIAGSRTLRALDPTGEVLVARPTKGGGGGGSTQTQSSTTGTTNTNTTTDTTTQTGSHPAADAGDFCFPLAFRPRPDWHSGARNFGARRDSGRRLHAGCDLLGPKGSQIYAIADGTLVRPEYYFYSGTHAVEIRHGNYIVRYGEILPGSYTGGNSVKKGQPICKIGRLNSGSSMLHFEMYSNGASSAKLTTGQGPYRRRADLMNPTALLDEWVKKLSR
jgi:peptidoglycan hydrolase-like protein with peptidoglycan-binding domain